MFVMECVCTCTVWCLQVSMCVQCSMCEGVYNVVQICVLCCVCVCHKATLVCLRHPQHGYLCIQCCVVLRSVWFLLVAFNGIELSLKSTCSMSVCEYDVYVCCVVGMSYTSPNVL